jgi:hypothetical protein
MTFTACGSATSMTNAEIIELHLWVQEHRTGGSFTIYGLPDDCDLAGQHLGEHAGLIGVLDGRDGKAWLRWDDWRSVDWLPDCAEPGCELYFGHPGECNPDIRAGMP